QVQSPCQTISAVEVCLLGKRFRNEKEFFLRPGDLTSNDSQNLDVDIVIIPRAFSLQKIHMQLHRIAFFLWHTFFIKRGKTILYENAFNFIVGVVNDWLDNGRICLQNRRSGTFTLIAFYYISDTGCNCLPSYGKSKFNLTLL